MHHNIDHSKMDHRLGRFWMELIVLAHSTKSSQPGESPLNNPTARQELETLDVVGSFHNLQDPTALAPDPPHQLACVAPVGPHQLQPWEVVPYLLEDYPRPVPILDTRRMNDHCQDQPHGIHQDVTLVPHDLLSSIASINPPLFVYLRRLTVDARCTWLLVLTCCSVHPSTKGVVNPLKSSVTGPCSKVIGDCPHRWKVMGQESPGASRSQQVEDRIEHLADVCGAWPAAELPCGRERLDNLPFFVCKIALVPLPCRSLVHDRAPPLFGE